MADYDGNAERLSAADQAEQMGIIEKFRASARQWWEKMQRVENMPIPVSSPLYRDKMKLVSNAHSIRTKIEALPGLSTIFQQQDEMGAWFLPLLSLIGTGGFVTWAVSAFKSTSNDADRLDFERREYERLVSNGVPPKEAMAIVKGSPAVQKREWADVAYKAMQLLPWIAGGYIAYRLAQKLTKKG